MILKKWLHQKINANLKHKTDNKEYINKVLCDKRSKNLKKEKKKESKTIAEKKRKKQNSSQKQQKQKWKLLNLWCVNKKPQQRIRQRATGVDQQHGQQPWFA